MNELEKTALGEGKSIPREDNMPKCVLCGRNDGLEKHYACVLIEHEKQEATGTKRGRGIRKETLTEIVSANVCERCEKMTKLKAVLSTIPLAIIATMICSVMALFSVRPNRNIRDEIASFPTVFLIVGAIIWVLGVSVFLSTSKEQYAAEKVRKVLKKPLNMVLVSLEPSAYTRKDRGPSALDIKSKTAVKTELAEKLLPVIRGEAEESVLQTWIGQPFTAEDR